MRVVSLTSGSCGNATLIHHESTTILIDAGVSLRYLRTSLKSLGLSLDDLDAVLLTHEHSDHLGVAARLSQIRDIPLWVTMGVAEGVDQVREARTRLIPVGEYFSIGAFEVQAFHVPHDSLEAVGFAVFQGRRKVSIATDLGCLTKEVLLAMECSDVCLIEANHEPDMLTSSSYPYWLRRRIAGPTGHLSNIEAAQAIARLTTGGRQTFMLCHLSAECNTPQLALEGVGGLLTERGIDSVDLAVAPRGCRAPIINI